jgi:hypothetical protein
MSSPTSVQVSVVGGPTVSVPWVINMNAQQAIEGAYSALNDSSKFTYALQFYGSQLGYLVTMINETYDSFASTAAPFYYWEFLVNGKPAQSGIDNTSLNPGDSIAFSFEPYDVGKHANSTLAKKHAFRGAAIA